MQPRIRLARPNARWVCAPKFLGDLAQNSMIVACAILRHCPPVHCLGGEVRISIASDHIAIPSFRIRVSLLDEGNTTKAVHQSSEQVIVGQITVQSSTLLAFAVVQEHSKCQSKHTVDRFNPQPGRLRRLLTSKFSGCQSSFLCPGRFTAHAGATACPRTPSELSNNVIFSILFGSARRTHSLDL